MRILIVAAAADAGFLLTDDQGHLLPSPGTGSESGTGTGTGTGT